MAYTPVPSQNLSTSSLLPHLLGAYYRRSALDQLLTVFLFNEPALKDILPKRNGRTYIFWRYNKFGANTTAKTPEGGVGTSVATPGSRVGTLTVSQYSDYMTVSDLMADTAPDAILENHANLIGYRGGLSVDTITRNVLDSESASTDLALLGANLKAQDFRNASHQLQGRDVKPLRDGLYYAISHPYVTFDLVNDPAANGLADIYKHTSPEKTANMRTYRGTQSLPVIGDCKICHSTNVKQITGTPNKWRTYIFGENAFGAVDLEGRGPTRNTDPSTQGFDVRVIRPDRNQLYDPEGVIGGAVAYKFTFGVLVLEGTTSFGGQYRFRTIDAPSTIVA